MSVAQLVTVSIILLLVATAVALLSRWLRVSYVAGLVLAGLALTELLPQRIGLNDSLILNLFLPILVFEAAINTDISRLRSTIKPISLLAGPGIVIASGVTAALLKWGLGLNWTAALLAGVILAITDTVSVIAVFKEVLVPSRLSTIVEGESLFNDGVALVLFSLIVKAHEAGSLTFLAGLQELFVVVVGGSLVGLAVGYLSTGLFVRADEPLSSILLTVAVALGAFQLGQSFSVSGVVAVVVAGLIVGSVGLSGKVSASTRLTLLSFWESIAFGVNSFIFLLIGIEVNLTTLWQILPAVLLAIAAYQIARIVSVYPLLAIVRWFDRPVPWRWQHVLFFGNIKGSLSMALALSIPVTIPGREQLIAIVFGTVLLSVVGQGVSLPWLVKRLQLSQVSATRQQVEELQAQLITAKAAQDELDTLFKTGVLPKAVHEEMRAAYQVQVASAEKTLRELYNRRADDLEEKRGSSSKLDAIRRRLLLAEKAALNQAIRQRILSEEIVYERLKKLDEQLLQLEDD
ncbi:MULTISPECIES: Na+/H+ antiporter [unclassified Tolypothrix]|uniref:Na+/H+ antiporter n=1 Tax=unclassified Tolypothrix TaxID=2649714 RepID=UPI0005EAA901|nr:MULTISPECIES: Na+/H+ antiporter [unclassified Tolypothrix]BAY91723.1 sodium/hydrogen exchanger [Microchaete diplosiphon NIES-3275]EKF05150.1 Na+/H+ antiporter [Tolypothrix sp. PCC 7601]MBE9087458.1 Na+/H+ antiporter [Tolypothrix sp. LEGE 11397]UYD25740.1 Na+/H+ antiporter [Tolypothrix sp. PCC 7712]UYD32019.1 Na+/H+ antiporter [Tolypothrix sp. PCC 7601]